MDEMVDRLLDILADKLTERLSAGHKELYTAKELAERYGVSCATIRSKMAAGEFGELVSVGERTRLVQKLRDAKEAPILPAAAPKVVELAAKEFNIRQNESEGILGHLIAGGDLSLYGLANAVTRHAQDVQSYDRSTELEATGYKIITMQPSLLKRWNEEVSIV